jgi:hypothetical protein
MSARTLTGSAGTIAAAIGDRFTTAPHDGSVTWEIASFPGGWNYSPSGIGGTPTVRCRPVAGKLPDWWQQWMNEDGTCDWCGDSVATLLIGFRAHPQSRSNDG